MPDRGWRYNQADMNQLVLLGDSVFDNGAYVPGGLDVCQQLCKKLPVGWGATLLVEPSLIGGAKLADRICRLFSSHNFETQATCIYF